MTDNETPSVDAVLVPASVLDTVDARHPWMCTATLRDGSGTLCRKPRMVGQLICASHGGQAPQNVKAAKRRLLEAIDPVIAQLVATALQPSGDCPTCGRMADAMKMRAMLAAIDRAFAAGDEPDPEDAVTRIERVVIDGPTPSTPEADADVLVVEPA